MSDKDPSLLLCYENLLTFRIPFLGRFATLGLVFLLRKRFNSILEHRDGLFKSRKQSWMLVGKTAHNMVRSLLIYVKRVKKETGELNFYTFHVLGENIYVCTRDTVFFFFIV